MDELGNNKYSLAFGAKAFLTNDKRLSKLQELIDVLVLDDFVE